MSLVDVRDLRVSYPGGERPVLDGVSFGIGRGESVGMIGESGSGKTQTALAVMGLLPPNAAAEGSVRFENVELLGAGEATLNRYRPCRMAMVFQDPSEALNPYLTIGDQLGRIVREHRLATGRDVAARVLDMLRRVGLPDPDRQLFAYPHQLSGGMRQRAMIAAALIGDPELLIADEPTTALDVTVQAQILELLRTLREELASALLLISHDLGVIAGNCTRMLVLDGGRLVEEGASRELFVNPRQARTRAMLAAATALGNIPLADDAGVDEDDVCLAARDVRVSHFERPFGAVWRLDEVERVRDVRLHLARGETLALVGESGSGKTSLARALLGLEPPRRGEITLLGEPLAAALERRPATLRRKLQLVFQDPAGSLNPAMRVADIVAEPLLVAAGAAAGERRAAVAGMLMRVGLAPELASRYPHELSGGQAQRVAIARALITQPAVLVCDEALAALDAPVRHDILELLRHEQAARGLSILFISHDLGVVKGLAHRVMVMYMGRICEVADSATLFARPRHPYTRALLDSVPVPDPRAGVLPAEVRGEVGSLREPPSGCVFHPRCRFVVDRCRAAVPTLSGDGASAACHRAEELDLSLGKPLPVWK